METIKILYIDDRPERGLSEYLDKYEQENFNFEYSDIIFDPEKGYESLISDPVVYSANIIFVDSRLFENRKAPKGKFTGEEFKVILKKKFPFIEVIVVSQNSICENYETIAKYDSQSGKTSEEYYSNILPDKLKLAIKDICEFRKIVSIMQLNTSWESVLIEKITGSINGCGTYDELTKDDIDQVITAFKELQVVVDK